MASMRRNGSAEVRELEVFIENDGQLYRSQHLPILKNLATKMARGTYNRAGAEKAFMHLMESGAKKYVREFSPGSSWNTMFTVADRKQAAKSFVDGFEAEYNLGNYDNLLPLKYKKKNPMDASLVGAKIAKVIRDAKGKVTGVVAHVTKKRNPVRKRNIAGFRDSNGVFHPIRSGVRYGTSGGKRLQWQDVTPYDESVVTGARVARKKKAAAKKKMSAAAAKRTPKAKKAAAAKKKAGARRKRNPIAGNITAIEVGKNRMGQYVTRVKAGSKTLEVLGGSSYRVDEQPFARKLAERYGVPLKFTAKDRKY